MSSVDFRGLVPASNDPTLFWLVGLMKKLAKNTIANQVEQIDSDNEDIYSNGQDMDTVIKYHSELSSTHKFSFGKDYYPPFEPDGNQVRLWIRGTNTGNSTRDISTFNHPASIFGDPTLVNGTIDLGIFDGGAVKSTAIRLNRPTSDFENLEWLQVTDHADIQITALATGFSIFTRFRLFSLADQNGRAPTIFEKIDDSTPNNGYMLQAKSDGRLVFIVTKGGTTTAKETAAGTVTTNVVYDIFVSFTVSGNVEHVYVNGVDKTLTTFAGSVNWQSSLTLDHDLFIFRRGMDTEEGMVYGDFYDYKMYRRIVSQAEVTHHYTNKWTISDIPFGQVMITNHWATKYLGGAPPGGPSFTSTSFTSTSFRV